MREVTQSGTTLLLVSHDLAAVAATAQRGIWLEDARVRAAGPVDEVLVQYRAAIEQRAEAASSTQGPVRLTNLRTHGPDSSLVTTNERCQVTFDLDADEPFEANLYVGISEGAPTPIFVVRREVQLRAGRTSFTLEFPRLPLPSGNVLPLVRLLPRDVPDRDDAVAPGGRAPGGRPAPARPDAGRDRAPVARVRGVGVDRHPGRGTGVTGSGGPRRTP